MKRALLCGCRRRRETSDAQKLVSEVLAYLRREHPVEEYGETTGSGTHRSALLALQTHQLGTSG